MDSIDVVTSNEHGLTVHTRDKTFCPCGKDMSNTRAASPLASKVAMSLERSNPRSLQVLAAYEWQTAMQKMGGVLRVAHAPSPEQQLGDSKTGRLVCRPGVQESLEQRYGLDFQLSPNSIFPNDPLISAVGRNVHPWAALEDGAALQTLPDSLTHGLSISMKMRMNSSIADSCTVTAGETGHWFLP